MKDWLAQLRTASPELPLYGVPFAIKDNIDLAGTPTTAACPAYAYTPARSAFVVERLIAAGAIPIGKTNMDQFATGLTGTRTPHGACASVVDPRYVAGGSSSGSAVVVADGTVPFALGTDTAGSGRVPAAFNGIVGFKPTLGRIGTRGLVPACRSLDCVSLLTTDVLGAERVLAVAGGPDFGDPYSRAPPAAPSEGPLWGAAGARIAVPRPDQLTFCGDEQAAAAWEHALQRASALGWELREIDFGPFAEAALLLYEGPWIAERYAAIGAFLAANRGAVNPIVRAVVLEGATSARSRPSRPRTGCASCAPRAGPSGSRPTRCCFRPPRRSTRSRRSPPSRSCATPSSGRTRTSSTCSTSAPSRCPPACAPTACRSASR